MILLRTPDACRRFLSGPGGPYAAACCIGNFDGIHLGHQHLFAAMNSRIDEISAPASRPLRRVLFTFYPHPQKVLQRMAKARTSPPRLEICSLRDKVWLAKKYGFDALLAAKFSPSLAALSPEEFVKRYLVDALDSALVVVGYDWSFGRNKAGNAATLEALGARYGFAVEIVPQVDLDGERISSSLVKQALTDGDLQRVQKLTGRPYCLSGRIIRGDRRGRLLGFRTANLSVAGRLTPPAAVYAVWAHLDDLRFPAAANLGVRPTFGGGGTALLEVHVPDIDLGDVYGRYLCVEFVEKIRDELKFPDAETLKLQMAADVRAAKNLLGPAGDVG